ncbi:hypothetical protein C0J52_05574 [Blattella germanica]|nr:hypothetical protein C0J52_05574 [Blattella germanica]
MVLIKIWCMLLYFRLAVSAAITVTEGVLQSGKTFDLTCHSDVPVHWCYPEKYTIPDHSERNIYKSPKNITYNKEGSKYSTTIQIQNANYVYTGFYHCLRNDTQSLCNRHVDSSEKSTYIFVKGTVSYCFLGLLVLVFREISQILICIVIFKEQ